MLSFRLAVVTCTTIAAVTFASPAVAAPDTTTDAPSIVAHAETNLGLRDDSVRDNVVVLEDGDRTRLDNVVTDTGIRVGDGLSASSETVYTSDRLSKSAVRLTSILRSHEASTAGWDFGPNRRLLLLADGRVSVTDRSGSFVAGIDAPWAVDARGAKLETYYTAEGSSLIQHVVYRPDTVFPVVADPTVRTYIGYWTVSLNKSESTAAVGTVGSCAALFSRAPFPGSLLGVGCGVFAAFSGAQLAGGKCMTIHVAGLPPVVATWWPSFNKC